MELILTFGHALCYTPEFIINGIPANYNDFGEKYDTQPEIAEPYGCGNMRFFPKEPENKIMQKYQINEDEFKIITSKLTKGLSFGYCGWCI